MDSKKVLVIEDSPTDAAIIRNLLERSGIGVEVAGTGEEGLKKAESIRPHLIVLDLMLPGMNGYEVCKKIRQNKALKDTLVVILSVKQDAEDINNAFKAGADDYVIKPPVPEFLVRKVKLYLGIR